MLNVPKLKILPQLERCNDGYQYPEEYIGKVYKYNDKYVIFLKSTTVDIPIDTMEIVMNHILESIKESVDIPNLDEFEGRIISLEMQVEELISKLQDAEKFIDDKLTEAYNNFMPAIDEAITKKLAAIESTKKTSDNGADGPEKLTLSQLFALKEMFSPEELIKMREAGLI